MNNEIESLNKEISDIKRLVLSQNKNLVGELEEIEAERVKQMKKVIYAYGISSNAGHTKVETALNTDKEGKFALLMSETPAYT